MSRDDGGVIWAPYDLLRDFRHWDVFALALVLVLGVAWIYWRRRGR